MKGLRNAQRGLIVGWGSILAAIIFFFNPDVGIIDVLPDFIGFILLCAALKKVAGIDDRVSEARELFRRMIYLTLVKFIMIFVMFGFIPTADQSVSMLMFTFIFSILELMAIIPAVMKLFDGILYLSSRHEGEAAFKTAKKSKPSGKTVTEKVRNLTVAFVIIKSVFRTLPEFAALTEQTYDETATGQLYLYKDLLREFGAFIVLIVAIIWMISALRYVMKLRRDKKLLENLSVIYNDEILTRTDRLARGAVKTAFGYFGAAAVFTLDFYIDNINILPDILSALCAIAALLVIRKYIRGWKIGILVSGLYGVLSLAANFAGYYFNTHYYPEAIMRDEKTYNAFIMVCGLDIASAAAFIAFAAILLYVVIKDIIIKHTGFSMTTSDTYDPTVKVRLLHVSLIRKLMLPMIFAALAAITSVIAELLIGTVGFLWIIEFLLSGLFAYSFIRILMEINEQISYKYMLS